MQFIWPDALWAFLVLPLAAWAYFWLLRRRRLQTLHYPSLSLIRPALGAHKAWRRHVPPALMGLALACGVLALARPMAKVVLPTDQMTLILAMDVSRSMLAEDVPPNRMQAAQEAVRGFLKELPPQVRVGVVTFAGSTQLVQAPTDDRQALLASIDRFDLQRGTATGSGLLLSLATLLPEAGIDLEKMVYGRRFGNFWEPGPDDDKPLTAEGSTLQPLPVGSYRSGAIVLLSDGRRTTGPNPLAAAKLAADFGVKVHTVAFGTPSGFIPGWEGSSFYVRVDEETLMAVAKATQGQFFRAQNAEDLRQIYGELSSQMHLEVQRTEVTVLASAAALLFGLLALSLSLIWYRRAH